MFVPMKTSGVSVRSAQKTLLYAHHGFGKTTQAKYLQEEYGPGFVISGESGLRSLMFEDIDYLPFSSWDGLHDPDKKIYSFKGICNMMTSPEFEAMGYTWIMIDSLTELSEQCLAFHEAENVGSKNGFKVWGDYGSAMLGACKWIRDLPYHVLVTSLAKEETDDNGNTDYWPAVKGNAVGKQLPGIFDNVFCGVRTTQGDRTDPKIERYIVTEEVRGWHGKARDPRRRLKPVEKCANVVQLFNRLEMTDSEYEKFLNALKSMEAAKFAPAEASGTKVSLAS